MPAPATAPEPTLPEFTDRERTTPAIAWYRTRIAPAELKTLHQRSDLLGALQTLGYLGTITFTAALALYSFAHWPWYVTVLAVFLHGTVASFYINAVHELGHGTVFRTRVLNRVFEHVFAFLGSINHEHFTASHTRHHRYTLHQPDDLEVTLPMSVVVKQFCPDARMVNPSRISRWMLKNTVRLARGRFQGEWETHVIPGRPTPSKPRRHRALGAHAPVPGTG